MKLFMSFFPHVLIAAIAVFFVYILCINKKNNEANLSPFPYRIFFILGLLAGILIPIVIAIVLTLYYETISFAVIMGNVYLLFLSNLIIMSIYTHGSKYVYEKIGRKRTEIILSGVFVFSAIVFLNVLFLKNAFLERKSSTDVFIVLIIPVYGLLSMFLGFFLGSLLRRVRKQRGKERAERD